MCFFFWVLGSEPNGKQQASQPASKQDSLDFPAKAELGTPKKDPRRFLGGSAGQGCPGGQPASSKQASKQASKHASKPSLY